MSALRRLLSLYRPYRGWLWLGILLSLVTLAANIGLLALSGWFIASMAIAGATGTAINYFTPAAIIRGLAMARTAGRYGERVVTHEATFRLIARLRVWFYQRIEPLAPAVLQSWRSGDLLSRLQKDIDRLDAVYLRILLPIVVAAVGVTAISIFIALHDPLLALINLSLLLTGGVALPLWLNRLAAAPGAAQVQAMAELRTSVIDGVQGIGELIINGADTRQALRVAEHGERLQALQNALQRGNALATSVHSVLAACAVLTVLLITTPMVREGLMPPANLAMLALFALAGFEAIAPLPTAFQVIPETLTAAKRIFDITDAEPAIENPPSPYPFPSDTTIVYQSVSLTYPGSDTAVLSAIDVTVHAGQTLLITGPSGAGKTSLFNLLVRFWQPSDGRITIGGTNIQDLEAEAVRAHIAVVSQHTHLMNDTIGNNLRLARPDATQAEIEHCCRLAHIHEFIEDQPDGYDTWVGETGVRVSGGQARRIAIARALLKDAPILLLDEPTEGLDPATEADVLESLKTLSRNKTILLISHRPLAGLDSDQTLHIESESVAEP